MSAPTFQAGQAYVLYCDMSHASEQGFPAAVCPDAFRKEVAVDLQALQQSSVSVPPLDSAMVAQVFGLGFGVVVLFFVVGRGVGEVLRRIRHG